MSDKKLEAVFIVGIDIHSLPEIIFEQYSKSGFQLIGDGKKGVSIDDLKILRGRIDENTRVDIYAHGNKYNDIFSFTLTADRKNIYT